MCQLTLANRSSQKHIGHMRSDLYQLACAALGVKTICNDAVLQFHAAASFKCQIMLNKCSRGRQTGAKQSQPLNPTMRNDSDATGLVLWGGPVLLLPKFLVVCFKKYNSLTLELRSRALARATSCFCPADKGAPPSERVISNPMGFDSTTLAKWALLNAAHISMSEWRWKGSRLLRMVPVNSTGTCRVPHHMLLQVWHINNVQFDTPCVLWGELEHIHLVYRYQPGHSTQWLWVCAQMYSVSMLDLTSMCCLPRHSTSKVISNMPASST